MRYDAHSGIAVLHGVGILEKGNQMAEPTSYIVEIDEQGNTSIKYADGTPYSVNVPEYSAEVLKQLAPKKLDYTVVNQIDGLYIGVTKGSEKFLMPYSPDELMEAIEDRESIQYMLDIASVELVKADGINSFFEIAYGDIATVDGEGNIKVKKIITEYFNPHPVAVKATFEEGGIYVNCIVTVNIGELEFGPFRFLHEILKGGETDAAKDENVDLSSAD